MNKKDLRELKKNFSDTSDLFTMNHVVTAFVDAEKNIRCQNSQAYHDIPQEEAFCYWKTFKKVLSGSLGKGLLEYEFPKEAYEEGAPQQILYQALHTKLKDESDVSVLLDQIVRQMDATSMYAILVAHCTYTVFNKTRNDEKNPYDSLDYSFLAVAICPVEVRTDGLIYNETDNEIMKKIDTDRIVAEVPSDGFLYPTFTGRGPDVNHVLYYTRKPKEVNVSLVEQVLGCKFTYTAQQEKEQFQEMLQDILGEELNYNTITAVNERIQSVAEDPEPSADLPVIDDIQIRDILLDAGVSEEKAEEMQTAYREKVQNHPLSADNLVDKKTVITAPGISVQVKKDFTPCVHLQNVDGHRYLMIDLDDPDIQVNGMSVEIPETTLPPTSEEAMLEQLGSDSISLESNDSAADEPDSDLPF